MSLEEEGEVEVKQEQGLRVATGLRAGPPWVGWCVST